jgi:hypothetical protein
MLFCHQDRVSLLQALIEADNPGYSAFIGCYVMQVVALRSLRPLEVGIEPCHAPLTRTTYRQDDSVTESARTTPESRQAIQ